MFKWKKLGQVFDLKTEGKHDWMKEQAQNPFAVVMGNIVRVYFNCRAKKDQNGNSKSLAGFVDLDRYDLSKIVNLASGPILQHGSKAEFDEFGIMAGAVVPMHNEYFLYYVGWTRMLSVPYNWSIGLAKSTDGGQTFQRFGTGPIITSTYNEPFLQAGCSAVVKIDNQLHLWYTSGIKWIETDAKPESVYQIMHATSVDGVNWKRDGVPVISSVIENEAQASPTVIKIDDKWHMFFSYRHSVDFRNKERGYRLGHAWSNDLITWHRNDAAVGLDVSEEGWDSEMVCYPHVQEIDNNVYMFYCGNDFGKEGFGIALLEK